MATRGSIPAVATTFAMSGILSAQAFARMPTLRDQVGATPGQLGLALVWGGVGSVVTMPWTGRLVERWGSRRTVLVAGVLACVAWSALAFARSPVELAPLLFLCGAGIGVWDVGMNVQGHGVERLRGRSLMPRLHAAYSAGTLLGALAGVLTARAGVPLRVQLPVAGALCLATLGWTLTRFVPDAAAGKHAAEPGATRGGVTGLELVIGVICLSTAIGEGAANDWLALLLVDDRAAPEAVGALAFAAFNLTMLAGRLVGGPAIERWGRVAVLRVSGACAAGGLLLLCLVPNLYAALLGGLLWGLGLATVFPATMSAAGEVPGRGQRAIGVVSSIGYGGFLLGSPTLGLAADRVGLDRALLLVAVFGGLIVVLAGAVAPRSAGAHPLVEPDTTLLR
ncbi:MAG TPA: MFS transporter [Dermatophilaceae bacterium]|nr:MFS transporter [Dermatophilaceae bacterium]